MWGSNARAAHPIFFHHVLKGIHNGAKMIVVDPRRTESAEWGDLWLGIDVGSDIALSNTIAREIIVNDLQHHTFIEHATTGFEAYKASVMDWTLERGEAVTGVPAEIIQEVAHAYAKADRAVICWTLGITEHHNGVDNVLALINLELADRSRRRVRQWVEPAPRPEQRPGRRRHGRPPEQASRVPGHRDGRGRARDGSNARGACRSLRSTDGTSPRCSTRWNAATCGRST